MTEGEPHQQSVEQPEQRRPWTVDTYVQIGKSLRTIPDHLYDQDLGQGAGYLVNPSGSYVALELYPARHVAKLSTVDVAVELSGVTPPLTTPKGVIFEQSTASQKTRLTVTASGGLSLSIEPQTNISEDSELAQTPAAVAIDTNRRSEGTRPVVTDSGAVETVSGDLPKPTESAPTDEERKQERVTLQGRVGRDPLLRTTRTGKTVAQFPLGVHGVEEGKDKTTWHQVVVFDKKAQALQGSVKKGDPVQVVGYKHEKEVQGKDGTPRMVEEIYAVVVKPR